AVSPFHEKPKTLGVPHWVTPKLVAQVRYTEITDDGRLRHPVYLGLRDDKRAAEVTKDTDATKATKATKGERGAPKGSAKAKGARGSHALKPSDVAPGRNRRSRRASDPLAAWTPHADAMTAQLDDLENRKKDGKLQLPDGDTLEVTNLHKVFWPGPPFTK